MGQQVGLLERRVVVRPISIVKTISKLTNSFTMMKFLAMFCLFIALFNEMEAKPIEAKPTSTLQDDLVSERQDDYDDDEDAREEEERQDDYDDDEDAREDKDEDEEAEEEEEDEDEGEEEEREEEEEVEEEEEQDEEDDNDD